MVVVVVVANRGVRRLAAYPEWGPRFPAKYLRQNLTLGAPAGDTNPDTFQPSNTKSSHNRGGSIR